VDGQAYLEAVAKSDPRTFCTLLGRVLPMTIAGDPNNPIQLRGNAPLGHPSEQRQALENHNGVQDGVSGATPDIKPLVHMRSS
jgi:hypothetical protein